MRVERFSLPLAHPLDTAAGSIERRDGFLLEVDIDGTEGLGEATPLAGWTESLSECAAALRSVEDPLDALTSLESRPAARHGVSLAVLDARARTAGEPLYRHLGGETRVESVPVNATIGDGTPADTAAAARRAVAEGHPALKVKVGARSLAVDIERLEAVRESCPDVELRADANGAWDEATAERAFEAFEPLDVAFVEQPLPADDLAGHAALRGGEVGVGLDEGLLEHGLAAVLEADAADVVVCKPMALGGVDRARETALKARDAGVDPVVTTTIDGAVARAGAVHLAASIPDRRPCGLATGDLLAEDVRSDVAVADGGSMAVPQGKGNIPPS
jgi:o-succinylbenzoate synthase